MKPINVGGHAAYQNRVLEQLRKYYPDAASSLPTSTWEIMEKFWNLDLSDVDSVMQDRYSDFGPTPRLPSDMLRSILLSVEFKVTSYTKWAAGLKENHLHSILSGFTIGDTPGTGTFYDFQSRLWLSDDDSLSPKVHPPKEKPHRPKKKGEKSPPVEKLTVKDLFEKFEQAPPQDIKPCLRLFQIFKDLFLLKSNQDSLIDLMSLSIAGDGTPVYTAAQERKKRTCSCLEKGIRDCKCNRIYSQPDCNIGWDSHRGRFYFGYGLYMLTAPDSENDLPILPFPGPASRHDSFGFLYAWYSMKQFLPEANVNKLLLDSAHDAMPYYEYCRDNGITPFIDLNGKGGRPPVYKDDFTINDDGVPVCREGHAMRRDGTESIKGRTVHLVIADNPRLFNDPPRSSEKWKLEYNARTSAERCNKREKLDYKLEDGRYRSSKMWYCRLFSIMMCQHLDAWALPKTSRLKDVL